MTNEIWKDEILSEEQLENITGGAKLIFQKKILLKGSENDSSQAIGINDFIPPAKAVGF